MDNIAALNEELGKQFLLQITESKKWRTDIIYAIQQSYQDQPGDSAEKLLGSQLSPVYRGPCASRFAQMILHRLRFKEMLDRHERISKAYQKTFQWIFKSYQEISGTRTSFVDWLRSDGGVYWITGKPGSGKSTLMKYVFDDPRTPEHLSHTDTPSERVVIAGFFFWNSGTSMQESQDGLLRTLLYDIIRHCEDLVPFLFPGRWEAYYLFNEYTEGSWTSTELLRALKAAIKVGKTRSIKFVFFIDGLDEFEGDCTELINLLNLLIFQGNVKICVASRP
jgi:hypothetical protein